jgi:protein-L-isoaspartate(D-aspartate) O-methyltransferase
VYTMEYHQPLIEKAEATLRALGYANVQYRMGNGRQGWAEAAPFDRILCAAAALDVPYRWLLQLADPGTLVMPVGGADLQTLVRLEKRDGRIVRTEFCPCRFVPLVGEAREDLAPPTGGLV